MAEEFAFEEALGKRRAVELDHGAAGVGAAGIEAFDSPLMPSGNHVSHGETTIADLEGTANAVGTIALNPYEGGKAAQYPEKELGLPTVIGPTPIGIRSTDTFLANLRKLTGKPIPYNIPMLRVGFPVYDRAGMYRHPVVGYAGAVWLAGQMANVLFTDMEHKRVREWSLNMW